MSETPSQDQATLSEGTVSFSSEEEYLDYVIENTKEMLGILAMEASQASQNGLMTPTLKVLFDASIVLISDMQHMALHRKESLSNIVTPPPTTLTDRFGNPLNGGE